MRINTNIPALTSYNSLTATNSALQKSINRLSTGLRINSAADDAAGLAISEKMRAQYRGLDQATSNAQDGISMIQTAEGALNETHSILQRMRELSVQAANDTLTQEDRGYIQLEIDQLKEEITRISTTTQFNKKQLLDGSAAALWSSDDLLTKATINGGLRETDQFGQKAAVEGNFRISVKATPGQAEVQKSDIFKIKHKNVIMNVSLNQQAGFESVRVDGLPAGDYTVTQDVANAATSDGVGTRIAEYTGSGNSFTGLVDFDFDSASGISADENQSILFEVLNVNNETGSRSVTFRVSVMGLDADGNVVSRTDNNFLVTTAGMPAGAHAELGWTVAPAGGGVKISSGADLDKLAKGDKIVYQYTMTDGTNSVDTSIKVDGDLNEDWEDSWGTGGANLVEAEFGLNSAKVKSDEVHFKRYYLNTDNGEVHEGNVVVTFNDKFAAATAPVVGASFEAAYVGQVAKGDVALRDLDKFWDANGKFMLDDPKTLSIVQGDGTKANVTLYSTDTLEDVQRKLNDAIANKLGQGKYLSGSTSNFVSFVERAEADTSESVAGTFVIRSLVPGAGGRLSLSGDEDIIKAFSLNVIQEAKENQFSVTVTDAHSGNTIASDVKITGNTLYGTVHENVDVTFDAMANIGVEWNGDTRSFRLAAAGGTYETILHLADNTTVFQIGANEGEDMGINIGNMSAEALGVNNILVTDRESAARSITVLDNAINKVSSQRARLGAYQNRLEHTINNLTTASTNMKSSESRIRDADMAKEMMNFTKLNILSQAGNSMLAQANSLPQNILTLLR